MRRKRLQPESCPHNFPEIPVQAAKEPEPVKVKPDVLKADFTKPTGTLRYPGHKERRLKNPKLARPTRKPKPQGPHRQLKATRGFPPK